MVGMPGRGPSRCFCLWFLFDWLVHVHVACFLSFFFARNTVNQLQFSVSLVVCGFIYIYIYIYIFKFPHSKLGWFMVGNSDR